MMIQVILLPFLGITVCSILSFLALKGKTKIVRIAGKDSHGSNGHNWTDGVDLLPYMLVKELVGKIWLF